jgi:hypothetical protein
VIHEGAAGIPKGSTEGADLAGWGTSNGIDGLKATKSEVEALRAVVDKLMESEKRELEKRGRKERKSAVAQEKEIIFL